MRVLVDAGALIALLNRNDSHHSRISEFFAQYFGRAYTTWPALTEAAHLVAEHLSVSVLRLVQRGRLEIIEISPGVARMADLMQRYADLPMDLADASLVWAAEHTGIISVVTLDRADFAIYRIKGNRSLHVPP